MRSETKYYSKWNERKEGMRENSTVVIAPLPRLWLGHITVDKRKIGDFQKLPKATSFIPIILYTVSTVLKERRRNDEDRNRNIFG